MTKNIKAVIQRNKIDKAWCRRCGWDGKTANMDRPKFDLSALCCPECRATGEEWIEYYFVFEKDDKQSENECPECGNKTTISRVCDCGWYEDYEEELP
jgi:ribosomal protein L37E